MSTGHRGPWLFLTAALLWAVPSGCGDSARSDDDDDGSGGGTSTGTATGTGTGTGSGGSGPVGTCDGEPTHEGEATYYTFADGTGNCSFAASPDDLMIGAMNHTDYADSAACGACVQLTGPDGTITIRIVDRCPECPQGDIDLSPEAFEQIAELSAGRVPISWQYVPCDVTGPIVYHFKEGSNPWWTAVQIRNHRHAIHTVEFQAEGGSFETVPRESYNYFVWSAGMGEGPYTLRVTDVYGGEVTDEGIPFVEAGDSAGAAQLPPCP